MKLSERPLRPIEMKAVLGAVFGGLLFLALLGVFFVPLERRFQARPGARVFHRSRIVDVLHWIVGGPLNRVAGEVAFVIAIVSSLPAILLSRPGPGHPFEGYVTPFMRLPIAIQIPLGLLVVDLFSYWSHRLLHSRTLWRFHAIHHSSRSLDWLAAARNHPINEAASRIFAAIPLVLLGIDLKALAAIFPVFALWGIFLHANVRWRFGFLRYVIATPLFHRWHHSRDLEARDKNFAGLFPIFDIVFGTFHLPDREPVLLGVDDEEGVLEGFVGQMLHPFRRRRV